MKYFHLYISIIITLLSYPRCHGDYFLESPTNSSEPTDSIAVLIKASKNKAFSYDKRKIHLDKAYRISLKKKNDSLRNSSLLKVSFAYYKLNDSIGFRKTNRMSIDLSYKLNDSASLAANYWDLAEFHLKQGVKDSAYYNFSRAEKIYELLGNNDYAGRVLLNMAIVQSDVKDFTGSEITTIKAISLLKPLKKYKHLYRCYNNLGICFNNLGEYDEALFYHNKALEYQKLIKSNNTYKENTLNNIGVSFELQKKYEKSIAYYQRALKNENLEKNNTGLYAKLLDNLAYSKFKLKDTISVKNLFYESLKIRDSINDYLGVAVNKLHLAEYYVSMNDSAKAKKLALETEALARGTKNYRELLPSLLLLSKLDKQLSAYYTNQYIKLNDSLLKEERAIRNKFVRIQFETDEFIDKNKRLVRDFNLSLLALSCLVLLAALTYVSIKKSIKNKELRFVRDQQRTNEEIYNLMLAQQNKLDEGRKREKKRISEELHDGVLGKLFGTRLILGSLNAKGDDKSIAEREKYINDLQDIEEEVRNVSHELNHKLQDSDIGYKNIIHELLIAQSRITNFEYETEYDQHINWEEIDGGLKMNLYRILQEAIQNINKYSKAKHVSIKFKVVKKVLSLSIKDDGIGFNSETKRKGIGLKNMKSRVGKFNGKLSIDSQKGKGTLLVFKIPLTN